MLLSPFWSLPSVQLLMLWKGFICNSNIQKVPSLSPEIIKLFSMRCLARLCERLQISVPLESVAFWARGVRFFNFDLVWSREKPQNPRNQCTEMSDDNCIHPLLILSEVFTEMSSFASLGGGWKKKTKKKKRWRQNYKIPCGAGSFLQLPAASCRWSAHQLCQQADMGLTPQSKALNPFLYTTFNQAWLINTGHPRGASPQQRLCSLSVAVSEDEEYLWFHSWACLNRVVCVLSLSTVYENSSELFFFFPGGVCYSERIRWHIFYLSFDHSEEGRRSVAMQSRTGVTYMETGTLLRRADKERCTHPGLSPSTRPGSCSPTTTRAGGGGGDR